MLSAVVSSFHLLLTTLLLSSRSAQVMSDLEGLFRILGILLSADSSRSISPELLSGLSVKSAWLSSSEDKLCCDCLSL